MSILYLCDEKRCDGCTHKSGCYHTSDIKHAVNFKDDGCGAFVEQPAILEAKDSFTDLVKELNILLEKYRELRFIRFPFIDEFKEQQKEVNEICEAVKYSIMAITLKIKKATEADNGTNKRQIDNL